MLKQLKEQISAFVSIISVLPKFKPSSVTVQTGFRDLVGNPEDCFSCIVAQMEMNYNVAYL